MILPAPRRNPLILRSGRSGKGGVGWDGGERIGQERLGESLRERNCLAGCGLRPSAPFAGRPITTHPPGGARGPLVHPKTAPGREP